MPEVEIDKFGLKCFATKSDALIAGVKLDLTKLELCDTLTRRNWPMNSFQELLWHELYSEYDSKNLSNYLHKARMELSSEFMSFERLWLRDEDSHCRGFKAMISQIYNVDSRKIDEELVQRTGDFAAIETWLKDEFQLCLLLAYDENVTAQAYRLDFQIYRTFANENLSRWIYRIVLDEVSHFNNLITIIKRRHPHRIAEIYSLLDQITQFDRGSERYTGTFLLDHIGFPPHLLETARASVARKCTLP